MWNEEDERNNTNQDDLSDMINAYSQDNELKKKINELKKQKAEAESTKKTEDTFAFSTLGKDDTQPLPKTSGIPDIQADDDLTKTRVGFDGDSAYDKTLVIMDSKPKATFKSEEVEEDEYEEPVYEEEEEQEESSETQVFQDLHMNQYDDEEEEEEEEEDEDLLRRKKTKSKPKKDKNPEADQKMNKIITYVIIGIVVVVLLVAGGFGVKYALGNFLSSDKKKDDPKVTDTNKPTENKPNKTDDNQTDGNDGKPDTNITDNSAEKAKVSGELKALEDQLKSKESEIATAKKELEDIQAAKQKQLDDFKTQLADLQNQCSLTKCDQLQSLQDAMNEAQKNADANPSDKALQDVFANAKTAYNNALSVSQSLGNYNNDYSTKMGEYTQKENAAQASYDNLLEEKRSLEIQISDKTTELNQFDN